MAIGLVLQDAQNSSAETSEFSPGAPSTYLLRVRAAIDPAAPTSAKVYLQMFDQNTAPIAGSVPVMSKQFDATGFAEFDFGLTGRHFAADAFFQLSSTPLTFTWASSSSGNLTALFDAQYI